MKPTPAGHSSGLGRKPWVGWGADERHDRGQIAITAGRATLVVGKPKRCEKMGPVVLPLFGGDNLLTVVEAESKDRSAAVVTHGSTAALATNPGGTEAALDGAGWSAMIPCSLAAPRDSVRRERLASLTANPTQPERVPCPAGSKNCLHPSRGGVQRGPRGRLLPFHRVQPLERAGGGPGQCSLPLL